MKNLLQLLMRYSVLLMFLAFEGVAFFMLFRFNSFQKVSALTSSNIVVAKLYEVVSNIEGYFDLRNTNELLSRENALLRNQLAQKSLQDTIIDLKVVPSSSDYEYIPAKVVNISYRRQKNYITINRGLSDGIEKDMGVVGPNGVVGVVSSVSNHFALVIPILNPDLSISCKLEKSGYYGYLQWNGVSSRYALLKDVARHVDLSTGDTIVSSGLSAIFPADILVGCIEEHQLSESDAYHQIKVRLATDFECLSYLYVVKNKLRKEQKELEENNSQ